MEEDVEVFEIKTELGRNNSISDAFFNLATMLEACNEIDKKVLAKYSKYKIQTYLDLSEEGIQKSSVKAAIKRVLNVSDKQVEEQGIKAFSNSLLKEVRNKVIEYVEKPHKDRDAKKETEELKKIIQSSEITNTDIDVDIRDFSECLDNKEFKPTKQTIVLGDKEIAIDQLCDNHSIYLSENSIKKTEKEEKIGEIQEYSIKVDKAPFKGNSMWEVEYLEDVKWLPIKLKFKNEDLLEKFQRGDFKDIIYPSKVVKIKGIKIITEELETRPSIPLLEDCVSEEEMQDRILKENKLSRIELYEILE